MLGQTEGNAVLMLGELRENSFSGIIISRCGKIPRLREPLALRLFRFADVIVLLRTTNGESNQEQGYETNDWRGASDCHHSPTGSNQALQQILQLAHLVIHGKGCIGNVQDFHSQNAFVVVASELSDDSAVLDLALPNLNLELLHRSARVPQVHMPHVGKDDVIILSLVWPGQEMARIESQAQS